MRAARYRVAVEVCAMGLESWQMWLTVGVGVVVVGIALKRPLSDYLVDRFGW